MLVLNEDLNKVKVKLDAFKRKYFLFKLLRGILFVSIVFIALYLTLIFIENEYYFSSVVRKFLFIGSAIFISILAVVYIIIPILGYNGILKIGSRKGISGLVGTFFPEIKDKLINVLELNSMEGIDYSLLIIQAAISQKSRELAVFDFSDAIKISNLKRIGGYFLLSIFISAVFYFTDKSLFLEPANRIVHFNREYLKPAPFEFVLVNEVLKVKKGESFTLKVKCVGDEVPSMVYLSVGGNNYLMKRDVENSFEYELSSVIQNINFNFTDLSFNSLVYKLEIIEVPLIFNYNITIQPPSYTLRKEEKKENIGDLKLAKGSVVSWNFDCMDTDSLMIVLKSGDAIQAKKSGNKNFSAQKSFTESSEYEILIRNEQIDYESVMKFYAEVEDDLYPEIGVTQVSDSIVVTRLYFSGFIKDDYGFTKLNFHISSNEKDSILEIPILKGLNQQEFYFSVDLNDFKRIGGDIAYYFSVTDNDRINTPKTTLSETYTFRFPSDEEFEIKKDENFRNIENLISESQNLTQKLKNEIKVLQLKSINNSVSEWEKNQIVKDIIQNKNELENILDKIDKMFRESNNYQNTFDPVGEEIAEKQKEIERLLDDVMTDELKKLLDEFNKLAEQFSEKNLNALNNKMDFSLDDLSKQLERNLEMLKKFKLEQKIEKVIEKIDQTGISQKKISDEVTKVRDLEESLTSVDEDLREMEKIKDEMKEIESENAELEKPMIFDSFEKEQKDITDEMQNSKLLLEKRNKKDASSGFKRSAEKLENLAFALKQLLNANRNESKGENILTIKRILKNLLYISVNQEDLHKNILSSNEMDPSLRTIKVKQKILSEQFTVVKDSLYALATRSPQIGNMVNEEIVSININMNESIKKLDDNNISQSGIHQRLCITSANNLILFLSDIVQKMEQQSNEGGDSNCENGENGKKMGGLKKSGGSLKDQLQQMIDQMKNGQGKNMSREMSESLMQHELMQKLLRDLINSGGLGKETKRSLQEIDHLLDQNRRDIMNKQIQPQLISRHNQVMTKLLEAERSENERDLENKRESESADDKFYSNPAKYFEGIERKNNALENLRRNPVKLTNFYREKQRLYLEKTVSNDIK